MGLGAPRALVVLDDAVLARNGAVAAGAAAKDGSVVELRRLFGRGG